MIDQHSYSQYQLGKRSDSILIRNISEGSVVIGNMRLRLAFNRSAKEAGDRWLIECIVFIWGIVIMTYPLIHDFFLEEEICGNVVLKRILFKSYSRRV